MSGSKVSQTLKDCMCLEVSKEFVSTTKERSKLGLLPSPMEGGVSRGVRR